MRGGTVYFAKIAGHDLLRVGCTATPRQRISSLQSWSPFDLEIIASIDAGFFVEGWLHHRYREHRHRGDWFRLCDLIRRDAATLAAGGVILGMPRESEFGNKKHGRSRVDELRRAHGLSFKQLSAETGVSAGAISQNERGGWGPAPSTYMRILDAFNARGANLKPHELWRPPEQKLNAPEGWQAGDPAPRQKDVAA